ncbi:MAG: hypothetical protein HC781_10040 [Leptolyngbyaceae cyanobacterium CSU_1_4]|nr:hypothetical protein [Leptolyngbyaceae cyanobacterium CSU_1_4]
MINSSFGLGSILGIILVLSGVGLYLLRTLRPTLARDQDIFFAAIALLCGGILVFQSWRLDPILQFAQFLSGASAIWFAVEAVRLRGITTEQAKRTAPPMVDDDRPVSRVYRAELDELTPLEDQRTATRRIRGGRDVRNDDWEEGTRRTARSNNNDYNDLADGYPDRPRRSSNTRDAFNESRPRGIRSERPSGDRSDIPPSWDEDDKPVRRPRLNGSESSARPSPESSPRPNSSRPASDRSNSSRVERVRPPASRQRRSSEQSSDYVDYQPIDRPDSVAPEITNKSEPTVP